jgi:hypothetical protein
MGAHQVPEAVEAVREDPRATFPGTRRLARGRVSGLRLVLAIGEVEDWSSPAPVAYAFLSVAMMK